MASGKGLHLTLVVNCVFIAFLSFTTLSNHRVKHFNNTSAQKNAVVGENIASKSGCVWSECRPTCPTTVRCNSCDEHTTKHWKHCLCYSIQSVFDPEKNVGLSFAFWYYFTNCWQILGNPSSSQIPGACDSQACCCQLCSTLDSSFMPPIIVVVCVISTGLLYCKVYAAVRHHTGTSSTEWRYGKRCKGRKIYTCYILGVCGVFSLLFANILCCFCQDHWWNCLVISFIWWIEKHKSQCEISLNPLIYCWKMRHISQTVMDHILRNILATDWFVIKKN